MAPTSLLNSGHAFWEPSATFDQHRTARQDLASHRRPDEVQAAARGRAIRAASPPAELVRAGAQVFVIDGDDPWSIEVVDRHVYHRSARGSVKVACRADIPGPGDRSWLSRSSLSGGLRQAHAYGAGGSPYVEDRMAKHNQAPLRWQARLRRSGGRHNQSLSST